MSTIKSGQIGQFRGKIGSVVVAKWKDLLVGRKTPTKSNKPGSEDQQDQRTKFGAVTKLLRHFSAPVAVGWTAGSQKKTAMNKAVSHHYSKAMSDDSIDYQVNYEKLLISRGKGIIDGGFRPVAVAAAGWSTDISWIRSNSTSDITQDTDKLTVVFFDENFHPGHVGVSVKDGVAERRELKVNVAVPDMMRGHALHVYMFFVSQNGKLSSKSEYLGIVQTSAM